MVVDDDAAVRTVATMMLKRLGYRVLTSKDGPDAVATFRARSSEIEAILLDVTMPEMDGWATLQQLRQIRPSAHVIMFSGKDECTTRSNAPCPEALSFLKKPFGIETLREALTKTLNREPDDE